MLTINKTERTIHGCYVRATEDNDAGFEFVDVGEYFSPSLLGLARFLRSMDYYFREAGASQITVVE